MLQPNLFTVIIRHPDCVPAIVTGLDLAGITAVALGASPVKSVEAFPAQRSHATDHADQIENTAPAAILAHAVPGGFDVEFVGAGPTPKWADEVVRALDLGKRREREARRLERINAAKCKTADTALEADRAKERVRGQVLEHSRDRALFELEQRARLVA